MGRKKLVAWLLEQLSSLILQLFLFVLCVPAEAQQRERVYRIGYLSSGKPSPSTDPGLDAFRQRLRELGYVEGQNVVIEPIRGT